MELRKCCLNCKWKYLVQDDLDNIDGKVGGKRTIFDCGRRYPRLVGIRGDDVQKEARDVPVMLSVVEREYSPNMHLANGFMSSYYCCYFESVAENYRLSHYNDSVQGDGKKVATLKSISRGFGRDSAVYTSSVGELTVNVSWALLMPFSTTVYTADGTKLAEFNNPECVLPHTALERLGYKVVGSVDFSYNSSVNDDVHISE